MRLERIGIFNDGPEVVRLSKAEKDALIRVASLLFELRDLRGDEDEIGIDIALAAHTCTELAEAGEVDVIPGLEVQS